MNFPLFKIAFETLKCKNCKADVKPTPAQKWKIKNKLIDGVFCSRACKTEASKKRHTANCAVCGKSVTRQLSQLKKSKSGNIFCSPECGTIWSNWQGPKFKSKSALEDQLGMALQKMFPEIEICLGDRSPLDSSVDIWIPSLKLAIEVNGPHHFGPIRNNLVAYLKTIKNDLRKIRQAKKAGIKLYVLNTGNLRGKKAFDKFFPQLSRLLLKTEEEQDSSQKTGLD